MSIKTLGKNIGTIKRTGDKVDPRKKRTKDALDKDNQKNRHSKREPLPILPRYHLNVSEDDPILEEKMSPPQKNGQAFKKCTDAYGLYAKKTLK
ncbi:MAG: hypothetical protein ACTSXQ_01375 [Alphaproteobacteria bacterium]